jgi:Tol biopolymer transport system component
LSHDVNTLVTTQYSYFAALGTAPSNNPQQITQLTSGSISDDGHMGISWTSDHKIIFSSKSPAGDYQIVQSNAEGSEQKRITSGKPNKYYPISSADGRYIVYMAEAGDSLQIWRMDANGDNPKLLSGSTSMRFPRLTPDSKWIICSTATTPDKHHLLKLSIDGTKQEILATHLYILGGAASPDGKLIAYAYQASETATYTINVIPSDGGSPIKTFEADEFSMPNGRLHWTPDGSALAYLREEKEVGNIYLQPMDGSAVHPLTKFTEGRILNFSWSPDGKTLAYSRGKNIWDIVLIQHIP